ncbi:MAG: pirin family protein [Actinomycetaceae bacterium]|nr:pirin family protein [Actinomycetaceae bacterium]MDY6083427.1 pirin family protein [Actinomycetaceae bacterium]
MPAVVPSDILALPRLSAPLPGDHPRIVKGVTTAPSSYEGDGFPVRRAFAGVSYKALDPFVHMDQMGEVEYAAGEARGTPWHPHRGFETVTYIIDGTFIHKDSNGGGGQIKDGDTQWMTAGSGLLHIERPPESLVASGGLFHGVQLWVNLPPEAKMTPPHYQPILGGELTLLTSADGGATLRVIAGEIEGHRGPGSTYTPITMIHATLPAGSMTQIPWRSDFNALVYVLAGNAEIGADHRPASTGQLAVMGRGVYSADSGEYLQLAAAKNQESRSPDVELLLLGGLPIGAPVAAYGPFVMNTREELIQAFEDFQGGRLGQIPDDPKPGHWGL